MGNSRPGRNGLSRRLWLGYDVLLYNILTVMRATILVSSPVSRHSLRPSIYSRRWPQSRRPYRHWTRSPVRQLADRHAESCDQLLELLIQRQFKTDYIFEVSYTGNRSIHQVRQGQLNPPILTPQQAATV